ncbi:MAG: tail fiber protein [Dehalococcoidia bacterium]|nr:tail fiber protein [Dehalococcoidia bacterium]
MSEPFLGEITIVGFNFAPRGWAQCDGQILPINQNQALYSLLGTTYGGDGRTTFALPDLRGRTPIHTGAHRPLGQKAGEETHNISGQEMAAHRHGGIGTSEPAGSDTPEEGVLPAGAEGNTYRPDGSVVSMEATTSDTGGGQPHDNMQPFLALNFVIALQGWFPPRN